jgi:hypothetical protein
VIGDQGAPRVVAQQILDDDVQLVAYVHRSMVRNGCRTVPAAEHVFLVSRQPSLTRCQPELSSPRKRDAGDRGGA